MSEAFRLSQQQLQIWRFERQLMSQCAQLSVELTGPLVPQQLHQALTAAVDGLEIFATRFKRLEGIDTPLQVVGEAVIGWNDERIDTPVAQNTLEALLERLRSGYRFSDIEDSPTLYADLLALEGGKHLLVLHFHPMCLDASSMGLLTGRIARSYAGEDCRDDEALQYIDASEYQYELQASDEAEAGRLYWQKLDFTGDYRHPLAITKNKWGQSQIIDNQGYAVIERALSAEGVSSSVVFAVWQTLLFRLSDEPCVVVGLSCDGRVDDELAQLLGVLNKVLPVKSSIDEKTTLNRLLADNEQAKDDIQSWQECFDWREQGQELAAGQMYFPLVFEALTFDPLDSGALHFRIIGADARSDRFELKLSCIEGGAASPLRLAFAFDKHCYDEAMIALLAEQFEALLEEALARPDVPLVELNLLPPQQRSMVLEQFNDVGTAAPYAPTTHQMFEQQVAKTPDAEAIECRDRRLSYAQLNALANAYARRLQHHGCGRGSFVGVYASRSVEAIAAILAIFKAGCVYVPLDPDYPQQRIDYMIEDSQINTLFVTQGLESRFIGSALQPILLGETFDDEIGDNLECAVAPQDGAYLIYTSGSTGNPKGTLVSHDALAWHCASAVDRFELSDKDRVLLFAPFNFDPSLEQSLPPLLCGATVVVRPSETWDVGDIADKIQSLALTVVNFPTSYWHLLTRTWQHNLPGEKCATLRLVISGGDKMLPDALLRWQQLGLDEVRLLNAYGPTETTVTASCADDFGYALEHFDQLPIGRPFPNRRMYVLDNYLKPQPVALPGELYIAGKSLASGYLNNPEQTEERFVDDPFVAGEKMYKTGDRAFYALDGQLYFLGRQDTQVKIRGYRIEPLEVEQVLNHCDALSEAAVVVRQLSDDEDGKQLVACYVGPEGEQAEAQLKAFLSQRLPEYMVPSLFIAMDKLPLSPSGKIDRAALIAVVADYKDDRQDFEPPQSETEIRLAAIWASLLEVEQIGRGDNFMELGGHSLLTMRLSALVREQFSVDFKLADLFTAKDLAALAAMVDSAAAGEQTPEVPLVPVDKDMLLPLSYSQEALWILDSLGQKSQYKLTGLVRLEEPLALPVVRRAMNELVARHDSLRTCFADIDGKPMQLVLPHAEVDIEVVELGSNEPACADDHIEQWNARAFDLTMAPLLRAMMLIHPDGRQVMALTVHHIVSDGLSTPILLRDFSAIYDAIVNDRAPELPALPIQYPDYAVWQREALPQQAIDEALGYWREQLDGYQNLAIETDRQRGKTLSGTGEHLVVDIDADIDAAVQQVCRDLNIGQTSCLIAFVYLTLKQYAQSPDFCLGMATATRDRVELEGIVGLLLNTLVLRFKENGDDLLVADFLKAGQNTVRDAVINQVPFEKLVDGLHPERSINVNPFFQVSVTYFESDKGLAIGGKHLTMESFENNVSNFEMSFDFSRAPDGGLSLILEYSTDLFTRGFIDGLIETLLHVMKKVPGSLDKPLGQIEYVRDSEQLLSVGLGPVLESSTENELGAAIEQGLSANPDKTALYCGTRTLDFAALHERVVGVAKTLQQLGVKPGDAVVVSIDRSINTTAAALGIVTAGAVYVPLDSQLPQSRIDYIVENCGARVFLIDQSNCSILQAAIPMDAEVLWVDDDGHFLDGTRQQVLAPVSCSADDPAYMIYTSGTTGQPKGVRVPRKAVLNLAYAAAQALALGSEERLLAVATTSFDMSILDIFYPPIFAATTIMAKDDEVRNISRLRELIEQTRPTVMQSTPVLWEMLFDCGWQNDSDTKMVSGGETPSARLLGYIERFGCTAYNGYGPTETTVYATFKKIVGGQRITLGRPIANCRLYVLDRNRHPVPLGALGELYIGGAGLSNGYLGRSELTEKAFVEDPFESGSLVYRTGDLAHWQAVDGEYELVFHGRADEQVKLRGFRIELNEIETALQRLAEVSKAAVVVDEQSTDVAQLVAYCVCEAGLSIDLPQMRKALGKVLPGYMVPTRLVLLESLPLNANRKIDKQALSQMEPQLQSEDEGSHNDNSDITQTEAVLLELWQGLFGHRNIGVKDNFFDLGGHSLLFVELQLRISERLNVDVSLERLFDMPVLADMAALIDAAAERPFDVIDPQATPENARLSYSQLGLWLSDSVAGGSTAYNMLFALRISGGVDKAVVFQALKQLEQRHEILRTTFVYQDGQPLQQVGAGKLAQLSELDHSGCDEASADVKLQQYLGTEAKREFDLGDGPLWHVCLVRQSDDSSVLVLNLHHICADGWSMRILIREFIELYQSTKAGQPPQLAALPLNYRDFAHWQREGADAGRFDHQLDYWQQQMLGCSGVTPLPLDRPRSAEQKPLAKGFAVVLDKAQCDRLRDFVKTRRYSLFNLLLGAYQLLLAFESGELDVVTGTDVANRSRGELENVVGFFTAQLPVRTRIDLELDGDGYLALISALCRELLANQEVPFELLLEKLALERVAGLLPLFQSKFYMDVVPAELYSTADSDLKLEPVAIDQVAYRSDLSLGLTDDGNCLRGTWVYNAALFDTETVERLAERFIAIAEALATEPALPLAELKQKLDDQEKARQQQAQQSLMDAKVKGFKGRRRSGGGAHSDKQESVE